MIVKCVFKKYWTACPDKYLLSGSAVHQKFTNCNCFSLHLSCPFLSYLISFSLRVRGLFSLRLLPKFFPPVSIWEQTFFLTRSVRFLFCPRVWLIALCLIVSFSAYFFLPCSVTLCALFLMLPDALSAILLLAWAKAPSWCTAALSAQWAG